MADLGCLESSDGDEASNFAETSSELQAALMEAMGAGQKCKTKSAGGCSLALVGCGGYSQSSTANTS